MFVLHVVSSSGYESTSYFACLSDAQSALQMALMIGDSAYITRED